MNEETFRYIMERVSAEHEYTIKRNHIIILVLIATLIITNVGWIYYENSFMDTTTIEQDAESDGNVLQNINGSMINGTGTSEDN